MKLETSHQRRPQSLNAVAAELAATVLVDASFWLLVLSMLSLRLAPAVLAVLVLLPVPLYFVSRISGVGNFMPVYAVFLPLLVGLVGVKWFGKGFEELFNGFARALNEVHGLTLFPFGDGYPEGEVAGAPAEAAILLLGFLTAGLFAYAMCRKVQRLAVPVAVAPALLLFLCGLKPSVPAFLFYLVSATFYLILLQTRSKGTARRLTWLNGEISATLLVFLMIFALLLSGFERSEHIEELRQYLADKVTVGRYAPKEETEHMPGGDLTEAVPLDYDGSTVLTIETPNAFSMYLRGFSGDVLADGKWSPLPADAYFRDYSLTGPWVRSGYFSPAVSLGQLLDLKWQVQTTQYENGERRSVNLPRYPVTITNERAYSDRFYAPYEVSAESKDLHHADLSQDGLRAEGLRGQRTYELTVYQPLTGDYGSVSADSLIGEDAAYNSLYEDAFAPTEEVYRAFVEANEREIPDAYRDTVSDIAQRAFGTARKPNEVIRLIRTYFLRNYTFSLDAQAPTPGEDPFLTFANETKTGYDAHFATLAVLLLREAGLPARYAEGYYVTEELAASVPQEEDVVLNVPDSASHAWVELYMDGVGWVPVEVTPGYFESGNAPQTGSASATKVVEQPEEVPPEPEEDEEPPSDGGAPDEETPPADEEPAAAWLLLLIPVLVFLLLVPVLYDRRIRKLIANADSPETVLMAWRYLMRVFRIRGLHPDEHRPKDTAPLLGEQQDRYRAAVDLIYKETFSAEGLSQPERELVCDTVLDLTGDLGLLRRAHKQRKETTENDREAHHGK